MSFRDVNTPPEILAWSQLLDRKWPERRTVVHHMVQAIRRLSPKRPHVVELGPGAGGLATALLTQLPHITYTGVELRQPLLDYTRSQLHPFAERVSLLQADLTQAKWVNQLQQPVHALISMQSLHDLGTPEAIATLYQQAHALLGPRGLLINADFVSSTPHPDQPGRLSLEAHLGLLENQGFVTLLYRQWGALGWVQGHVSPTPDTP